MTDTYHTIVIGSGSGGFTVAIGLTGLGKRVAVIERAFVGGDCTNVGCIPSKALIHQANEPGAANDTAAAFRTVRGKRDRLRDEETAQLRQTKNLDLIFGHARFLDAQRLEVTRGEGDRRELSASHIVIATGSRPRTLAIPGLPDERTLTNERLFELHEAPQHLAIVGSGSVALEMACAFRKLGSAVTIVSRGERILAKAAAEASAVLERALAARGIAIHHRARPQAYDEATRTLRAVVAGFPVALPGVDRVLLAIGRERNVDELNLERAGIEVDAKNGITVDGKGRTSVAHIYAIGDVTPDSHWTHSANAQGRRVVQQIALPYLPTIGGDPLYPQATFSDPEVASVGLKPETVAQRYHPGAVRRVRIELKELDRGYTDGVEHGFVLVEALRLTGRILGATIVGPHAGEMITIFTLAISRGLTLYSLYRLVFPYPTLAEGLKKAADAYVRETLPHLPAEVGAYLRYRFAKPRRGKPRLEPQA